MKLCKKCGQLIAEDISVCPACGQKVVRGRKFIDDYRIEQIVHEGYASILCKAVRPGEENPVMIRIFTFGSGVDEQIANRLKQELKELRKLSPEHFVAHYEVNRSADGAWYRVSEWVAALNWGDLVTGPLLKNPAAVLRLFIDITAILDSLHRQGHFIPHLILDDIMVTKDAAGKLDVKVDYKLSRFLDPNIARPGPMLKHLIENHPDIKNGRPLDFRSDIWSLGKIFLEILTADFQSSNYMSQIKRLPLPERIRKLFKTMLADDPDLRPQSMADVVRKLESVKKRELRRAGRRPFLFGQAMVRDLRLLKKRQRLLAAILAGMVLVLGTAVFYYQRQMRHDESMLVSYAEKYSEAVAFVLVEYWLSFKRSIVYKNRTEGTAFLVDGQGHLLTNRHVACPWLEDDYLLGLIETLAQHPEAPEFGYRLYLWFEGERAFFKSPALSDSVDLADIYVLESAYRSDGDPQVAIAGVPKPAGRDRPRGRTSIKDDFAVLKIDAGTVKAEPIPLHTEMDAKRVARLSPVMALGFPLGRRTQDRAVNVSVTRGYVRRSFEDLLQVDSSIHMGSSGGPIIDMEGRVIGIASSVASERLPGPLPVVAPLADIGMVLPISRIVPFLNDLRKGHAKWNGVLDLALRIKLKTIGELALGGKWQAARDLALAELERNPGPTLSVAAGMLTYCTGDLPAAKAIFKQALSMDAGNDLARLMLFLIDWHAGYGPVSPQRLPLLRLDWRSPGEFTGFVARVLDGQVNHEQALAGWDTPAERGWLNYFVGIDLFAKGDLARAQQLVEKAVLAADIDTWIYFLARKKITEIRHRRLGVIKHAGERDRYQEENKKFDATVQENYRQRVEKMARQAVVYGKLAGETVSAVEKKRLLEQLLADSPDHGDIHTGLVFYYAMGREWDKALDVAGRFLEKARRESAARLSIGLLVPQIKCRKGQKEAARRALQAFVGEIKDPWYLLIGKCLLGQYPEKDLINKAQGRPEDLITAHVALGFQAEAENDTAKAIKHYKEALTSYLSDWIEYDFARSNLNRLRAGKND